MMTKFILVASSFVLSINVITQQSVSDKINWPAAYEPAQSKFYVHNEIEIDATPSIVWEILIDAFNWQSWYKGAKNVSFVNSGDSILTNGTVFR